jgi:lysozyme family protein
MSIPLYVAGKDFKVKDDVEIPYCYGVGAVHQVFVDLQELINRFAQRAGFKPVKADGFLGEKTVAAANRAAALIQTPQSPESLKAIATYPTKETLAANAAKLVHEFRATADAFDAARPAT